MQGGIDGIVENLRIACGFGHSEGATEDFLDFLYLAVEKTISERDTSHADGLCLDCQSALSGNLRGMMVEK